MDIDFHTRIEAALSDNANNPDRAAHAIVDVARDAKKGVAGNSGAEGEIQNQFQAQLKAELDGLNGLKSQPYSVANENRALALLTAANFLQSNHHFFFNSDGYNRTAQAQYWSNFDPRSSVDIASTILTTMHAAGLDPARVERAKQVMSKIDVRALQIYEKALRSSNIVLANANADQSAQSFAANVSSGLQGNDKKVMAEALSQLTAQQKINPQDIPGSALIKGLMLASVELNTTYDADKNTFTYNGKTLTSDDNHSVADLQLQIVVNQLNANHQFDVNAPPISLSPKAVQPPPAAAPTGGDAAAAASPPQPDPKAGQSPQAGGAVTDADLDAAGISAQAAKGNAYFALKSAVISAADQKAIHDIYVQQFKANKPDHGKLKIEIDASADGKGTDAANQKMSQQREKALEGIALQAARDAGVTLEISAKPTGAAGATKDKADQSRRTAQMHILSPAAGH